MTTIFPDKRYIKTRRDSARISEFNSAHIHVDAQEVMPEHITRELVAAGLVDDSFEDDFHYYGKDGDPTRPFPHYAPVQHHTLVTSNLDVYQETWRKAVEIVEKSGSQCYIEGELIVLDEPLPVRPFDQQAFDELVPEVDPLAAAPFAYRSAITGEWRSLPVVVAVRRLDPVANGPRDRFRRGEMHLTVRDDTHPKLLELLCNLGFSVPAIPKLIEGENGSLERNVDGSFRVIRDIPLTLQTVDMRQLMKVANLAVSLIERIGGVVDGSVKIEFATHFAVLNGVDYNRSVPPVLAHARFRPDFDQLGYNQLGSIEANLAQLTRAARKKMRSAPHEDQIARYREIWTRTLDTKHLEPNLGSNQ